MRKSDISISIMAELAWMGAYKNGEFDPGKAIVLMKDEKHGAITYTIHCDEPKPQQLIGLNKTTINEVYDYLADMYKQEGFYVIKSKQSAFIN